MPLARACPSHACFLQVQTDTPAVKDSIRGVLSLLKANHPADCMTCDVNGEQPERVRGPGAALVGQVKRSIVAWR